MRRYLLIAAVVGLALLIFSHLSALARAQNNDATDPCHVATDRTVSGNFYALCQDLIIDGKVDGDLVGIASTVIVNGTVEGDVLAAAGQVIINGTVGGDVRAAAAHLELAPSARLTNSHADVAAVGLSAELRAPISGDLLFGGYETLLDTTLGGNAHINSAAVKLNGRIQGNADLVVEPSRFRPPDLPGFGVTLDAPGLTLSPAIPLIKGNLRYTAPDPLTVPNGTVGGEVEFIQGTQSNQLGVAPASEIAGEYVGRIIRDLLALMVIGLAVLLVAQGSLQSVVRRIKTRTVRSFGYGLAAFFLSFPIMLVLIVGSVILLALVHLVTLGELTGIVGVLLAILNLAVIGGFWFVVLFLTRLVVCFMIGQYVGRRWLLSSDRATSLVISLLLGTVIYSMIANLGVIGVLLNFMGLMVGLGAIVLYVRDAFHLWRVPSLTIFTLGSGSIASLPSIVGKPDNAPVPPPDPEPGPGLDNLPDGFTWFD